MTVDPPASPGRPPSKGERTRREILRVASELLASRPPASIRMEEIADAANVSVGTLYKYFPSKDAIVLAFTADAYDVLDGYLAGIADLPSPLQRVYAAGDAYLQFAIERPAYVRFMIARGLQPADDAGVDPINERIAGRVREMLIQGAVDVRDAMLAEELPTIPVDEMIVMLFGLWNGVAGMVVRLDDTAVPPELAWRALERARSLFHRALAHTLIEPSAPGAPWEHPGPAPS